MSPAEAWLRGRLPEAPAELLRAMIAALPARAPGVPGVLAEAAVGLYATLVGRGEGREDALPLLAADALLTHAFQAQAEVDPDGITRMATEWGARGRLGEVGI